MRNLDLARHSSQWSGEFYVQLQNNKLDQLARCTANSCSPLWIWLAMARIQSSHTSYIVLL